MIKRRYKLTRQDKRRGQKEVEQDLGNKIVEVLKYCRINDEIIFEDKNGYVFKIRLVGIHEPKDAPKEEK